MAHIRVLLENNWRTPLGRFDRSMNGVPTLVPKRVIRRYALPSTAVIVSDSYVPPAERDENTDTVEMTAAEHEAEINRRAAAIIAERDAVQRGLRMEKTADAADEAAKKEDEKRSPLPLTEEQMDEWEKARGEERAKNPIVPISDSELEEKPEPEPELEEEVVDSSILDNSIPEITKRLVGLNREQLLRLRKFEEDGNTRKGTLIVIDAALEDLEEE